MTAVFVFALVMALVFFVLGCMGQRKLFWNTQAWRYRNPEAHEPSDAALGSSRAWRFVGAAVMLAAAGLVKTADNARTYSTEQVRSVAEAAASRLEEPSTPGLSSSFDPTVYDIVNDEGDGNVKVRSAGTDKYELTNRKGKHPVCLTAKTEDHLDLGSDAPWSHSTSTSVEAGRC
jgi:hypothetical protein